MANSQRWVSDARKITYPRAFTSAMPTRWNHGKLGLKWVKFKLESHGIFKFFEALFVYSTAYGIAYLPVLNQILRN